MRGTDWLRRIGQRAAVQLERRPQAASFPERILRVRPQGCWIRTLIFTCRGLRAARPAKKLPHPAPDFALLVPLGPTASMLSHPRGPRGATLSGSLHAPSTMLQVHASAAFAAPDLHAESHESAAVLRRTGYWRIWALRGGSTSRTRFSCARLTSSSVRVRSLARYLSDRAMLFLSGAIPSPV